MIAVSSEYAEALALAIECGFADPQEARDWAAQLVLELPVVPEQVHELAGAIRPHPLDVVGMLRRLPGASDPVHVFRLALRRARDWLRVAPDAWPRITIALEQLALRGYVRGSLAAPCFAFDDQRLLAEQGVYGSLSEVRDELIAYLEAESETDAHGIMEASPRSNPTS